MNTLKEETFALRPNPNIFTFHEHKLSWMTNFEKFCGYKLLIIEIEIKKKKINFQIAFFSVFVIYSVT